MKKCIVISDSFKGSLPSRDICAIARERIPLFFPACEVRALNVADGGEGTVEAMIAATQGKEHFAWVTGPLGERVKACWGMSGDGVTAALLSAHGIRVYGEDDVAELLSL